MAHVYVYSADNENYSTIGECGALDAVSCTFEEVANGMSEISLMHPIDALGKYKFLEPGAVLKASVPVRTTPEIENGQYVTRVETWKAKGTSTKQERYVYNKRENGKVIKLIKTGTKVTVTQKPADSARWKIKSGKTSGWIASSALEMGVEVILPAESTGIEAAAPAWESREQLFRIYRAEKESEGISCSARHIQYDLLTNMTTYDVSTAVSLQTCGDNILNKCIDPHDFQFYTDISGTHVGAHYADTDPITAFLNPEEGAAAVWGAQLVRDNFDIYMLANAGMDRGMRIEYAKNMLGVQVSDDISKTATAIRPIGRKKDGSPFYLPGDGLVKSDNAAAFPMLRIYKLECENCTIGKDNVTETIARARMREQARALLASGVDRHEISVRVTFASLGHAEKYSQYRNLENAYLYDYVTIAKPNQDINLKTQVIRIMWDCLREKMLSAELGSLLALSPSVAGWQISGGISGGKLIYGSVGASQLSGEAISARHIQAESINTEALQAGSVTAEKIAAGAITADKIAADAIDTVTLEAITAKIESLTADDIDTDRLAAALAAFTVVTAGTADFDRATVQHLVAKALNLEFGTAEQVFIKNLAVEFAQMVSASVGELCIKASDGNYYLLDVGENGSVTATKTTVSDSEITAGETSGGKVILETNITAANLNTGNLLATYALVNQIDAARIDVDQLFAREAFINLLRTKEIFGNESITIIAERANKSFRQEDMPTEGIKLGDTWRKPSTGETYQAEDASKYGLKFYLDSDGNLLYELAIDDGSVSLTMQDYDLVIDGIILQSGSNGDFATPVRWILVQDSGMMSKEEFQHYVRIADDGLHVGAQGSTGEVVIDHDSVDVVLGGRTFSSFAANYVEFGNYQLRRTADGGLAFKMR